MFFWFSFDTCAFFVGESSFAFGCTIYNSFFEKLWNTTWTLTGVELPQGTLSFWLLLLLPVLVTFVFDVWRPNEVLLPLLLWAFCCCCSSKICYYYFYYSSWLIFFAACTFALAAALFGMPEDFLCALFLLSFDLPVAFEVVDSANDSSSWFWIFIKFSLMAIAIFSIELILFL